MAWQLTAASRDLGSSASLEVLLPEKPAAPQASRARRRGCRTASRCGIAEEAPPVRGRKGPSSGRAARAQSAVLGTAACKTVEAMLAERWLTLKTQVNISRTPEECDSAST